LGKGGPQPASYGWASRLPAPPPKISKTTPCTDTDAAGIGALALRKHSDTSGKSAAILHRRSLVCFSDHQTIPAHSIWRESLLSDRRFGGLVAHKRRHSILVWMAGFTKPTQ
jgi:hypothetical protein